MNKISYDYIKIFDDNYIWCLHNGVDALVIDPGDANKVIEYLTQKKLNLTDIFITHHHEDHIAGVSKLVSYYSPNVYSNIENIATNYVAEGSIVQLISLGLDFQVLETPGHTLDHIVYYGNGYLFVGDTIFSGGCGRVFEGTYNMMYNSLNKICQLPQNTLIFPSHEYTLANLKFALHIEPNNQDIHKYNQLCIELRKIDQATIPVTLAHERLINPFLRCDVMAFKSALNMLDKSPQEVFTFIRDLKNNFKLKS